MNSVTEVKDNDLQVVGEIDGYRTLIQDFLASKSENTHRAYKRDLESFADWLGVDTPREALRTLVELGHGKANQVVMRYKNDLRSEGLAPATINRRLSAIRSLIEFAQVVGFIEWSLNIKSEKVTPLRDTRGPGEQGVLKMMKAAKNRQDGKGTRDYAILRLLNRGLRRAEVVSLDMDDLELGRDRPQIWLRGKGRNEKERVEICPETVEALRDWIDIRGDHPGPLFGNFDRASKGNGRLSPQAIYNLCKHYGKQVGVDRCHPHGLRHTAITGVLELTGGDVHKAQQFSRHKSLQMLVTYNDNRKNGGGEAARMWGAKTAI